MNTRKACYRRHRFPPEIISYSVWAYHRFALRFRDVEDLLAERGIVVDYEPIRRWCLKFRPHYQQSLKRRETQLGDHWYADEVFVTIRVKLHYLSRHQAPRFLSLHARVSNLFRYDRHLLRAANHRLVQERAFKAWRQITCA